MSCSIVFSQMPPNKCHLLVRCCTDPFGAAYSNVQIVIWEGTINRISSLHSNMFACGTWRRWRLIVTMLHAVQFCKIDELYNWIYDINLMLLHWLLYSELWCYLLIQGIAHLHRSSTFSKRWGTTRGGTWLWGIGAEMHGGKHVCVGFVEAKKRWRRCWEMDRGDPWWRLLTCCCHGVMRRQ
jgi:hypothetical protein